jgi:cytochrome bd-type quinol oxidase subunit 2
MSREQAVRMIRLWTIASGVAGFGLTAVLGVVAAHSFAGRTIATTRVPTGSDVAPQAVAPDSLGNTNQPPAAVSGGS